MRWKYTCDEALAWIAYYARAADQYDCAGNRKQADHCRNAVIRWQKAIDANVWPITARQVWC